MGHRRVRGSRAAHDSDEERAPRSGRRRKPRKRQPFVLDFGPPQTDDVRGFSTGGRRSKGGRGGRHQQLVDDALEDEGIEEDNGEDDDYQDLTDAYLAGDLDEDEGGEQQSEQESKHAELTDREVSVVVPPDPSSGPVQLASPELESLEDEASEAIDTGTASDTAKVAVQVEEKKVELLEAVVETQPATSPVVPVLEQAIEEAKHTKADAEESERDEHESAGEDDKVKEEKGKEPEKAVPGMAEIDAALKQAGLTWDALNAEEQQAMLQHGKTLAAHWDAKDHSKPNPNGGKLAVKRHRSNFEAAVAGIDQVVKGVRLREQQAAANAQAEQNAKQFAAAFAKDKQELAGAVQRRSLTAGARDVLTAVLDEMKLSSGGTEEVAKAFPEKDIVEAHRNWKFLINQQGKIGRYTPVAITELWNPGWQEATIGWKERGPVMERNRNFMAKVGKHTVNIHVSPPGPRSRKK